MRACMFTAIAFWPRKVDVPKPIPRLASRSSCGIDAIAPTAAIPCFAIWSVCCSCEPNELICACWPDSVVDSVACTCVSWFTFTASVPCVPGATFVIWRCCVSLPTDTTFERPPSVEFAPIATEFEPAVTVGRSVPFMSAAVLELLAASAWLLLIVVDSEFSVLLMFVTPVDRDATLLFVVLRPVDSEPMPVEVDVDNELTLLFTVLRPVDSELIAVEVDVDSEATLLFVVLRPVDNDATFDAVDVDSVLIALFVAFSWLPLIASVLEAEIRPAATFVIWRS